MIPDRQELAQLVAAGMSDQEVGDRYGVTSRTVLRWRRRHGLASRWTPPLAPHGTVGRYQHPCRCAPCRAANAADKAVHRARLNMATAATAHRAYEPWTAAEDAAVLSHTPKDAARLLGRSWDACRVRRSLLRRRARQEVSAAA